MTTLICNIMALVTVVGAILVVANGKVNAVYSVLWLIVSFVAAACYLVTAGMAFLGLSYVIVYVGAIAVLFLFVVMMLNIASFGSLGLGERSNEHSDHSDVIGVSDVDTAINAKHQMSVSSRKIWPIALLIMAMALLAVLPLTHSYDLPMPMSVMDTVNSYFFTTMRSPECISL